MHKMTFPKGHLPGLGLLLTLCAMSCGGGESESGETERVGSDEQFILTTGQASSATFNQEQAEAVATWRQTGGDSSAIIVTFNDRTESAGDPKEVYSNNFNSRTVYRGVSLMGWARSTDEGNSYSYGGKVSPPSGWSAIWGDPAITQGVEGIWIANLASSNVKFPASGQVVDEGMGAYLDGFCVARSSDDGVTFPTVACVKDGLCSETENACTADSQCPSGVCNGIFYDGTSLQQLLGTVYFAAQNVSAQRVEVWKSTNNGQTFTKMQRPFAQPTVNHPRLVAYNSRLYVAAQHADGRVIMTYLQSNGTWYSPKIVSQVATISPVISLGTDREIRTANQFDFAVGPDPDDAAARQVRIAYTRRDDTGKYYVETAICPGDLPPAQAAPAFATCNTPGGYRTVSVAGDQLSPNIAVATGYPVALAPFWNLTWLQHDVGTSSLSVSKGVQNSNFSLSISVLVGDQVPCSTPSATGDPGYWGDYNDLTFGPFCVGDPEVACVPQFLATYTQNDSSCDFRGDWTADMHVGASIWH